jgi:hypothetical protein
MDCSLIQGDLIAYQFAVASDAERARVEAHLVECTVCLRAYLALKAHVDGGGSQAQPSEESRLRLRAAVADRFRPTPARRVRRWLARPIPLYQGIAVAAVVLLGATLGPIVANRLGGRLGEQATADVNHRVDTSRTTSQSLSIY